MSDNPSALNPPAFPSHRTDLLGENAQYGMSLRDYFAGQALLAQLTQPPELAAPCDYAAVAYAYADAMLAARTGDA